MRLLCALVGSAALLAPISSALAQATTTTIAKPATDYPDFRKVVQDAKEKVFPAVVYIRVIREVTDSGKRESQAISGSGVIISSDGEVLTNWHVIDKSTVVRCLLTDGRHFDAKVIGSDKDTDLALIQLQMEKGTQIPSAKMGDSTVLHEGDFVMAMGAPWGLNRSVSIGIISCVNRYLDGISEYVHWLQTDAAINPGNSGGPLVNTNGEVIGINARGTSGFAEGLGFSIPSEAINIIIPRLRKFGKVNWTWTGLQLQPLRDFNKDTFFSEPDGVIVSETDPESPARRAGIQPKDRIVRVNGTAVTVGTNEDLPSVQRLLGLLPPDKEISLDVVREGKEVNVKFTPREKGKVEGDELALKRWDCSIKAINQFDNPDLFFYRKEGVFVHGTRYPGNASNAGLYSQDIILKIDGKDVTTIADVQKLHEQLVANVETKNRTVVTVLRRGTMRQVVLDFQRDYSKE